MSGVEVSTTWARFRRRLGLAQLPAGHESGSTLPPAAEPPSHLSRDESMRQFRERRSDESELASGAPARQGADHERGVVESLARGARRSITPDGLEWLLRRYQPSPVTPAAQVMLASTASQRSDALPPASSASASSPSNSRPSLGGASPDNRDDAAPVNPA
jgi:hypothetical protein